MDAQAPDLIDAVIGFRQWRLHGSELWSLRGEDRWLRGIQTAQCDEGTHDDPAPAKGCTCGLYALYRPVPRGASAATSDLVAGAVALWGQIELHAHGLRAQHALVLALALPFSRADKRSRILAAAETLDVPAVPARRLMAEARQHGDLIPRRMRPPDTMPHKRRAPGEPAPARLYAVADGYAGRSPSRSRSGQTRARLVPGGEFEQLCRLAAASGWRAPSADYLSAHGGRDHLAVLPRGFAKRAGETRAAERRTAIAVACDGISLARLGQGADGNNAPIVSASELLAREDTVVELPVAALRNTATVLVRELWFEAFIVERAADRLTSDERRDQR
jgi:hypothetical protein